MRSTAIIGAIVLTSLLTARPAVAQRSTFQRTFRVGAAALLDVETMRGKVDISPGEPGRVVIDGVVTVRVGWDVPANAVELARQVTQNPPVAQEGDTIRLRPPARKPRKG